MQAQLTPGTLYFKDAVGVFEGGGVLGTAYAGAIEAAEAHGVRLRAAIGTSVGSIVAALVAGGLKADEMLQILRDLPLRKFISQQVKLTSWWQNALVRFGTRFGGKPLEMLAYGFWERGRYSSEPIEQWVNDVLLKHGRLKARHQKVTFDDLPLPLAVLATDLTERAAKVWTTDRNPHASVAFAVRCSCSIPFFFQPVVYEGKLLVDGGLISNLPSYESLHLPFVSHLPVLAFRLVGDADGIDLSDTGAGLLQSLISSMISGHTAIQLDLGPPAQVINIHTGTVSATDFHISPAQIGDLIKNGRAAVNQFFEYEMTNVAQSGFLTKQLLAGYRGNVLEHTMLEISRAKAAICMFAGDISWTRDLAPALMLKSIQGVAVRVLYDTDPDPAAITILNQCGCAVQKANARLGIYGTLIDPGEPSGSAILVRRVKGALTGQVIRDHNGYGMIEFLSKHFDTQWGQSSTRYDRRIPMLRACDPQKVADSLAKHVTQYRDSDISIQSVPIGNLSFLTDKLETWKLRRVEYLAELYHHFQLRPFEPVLLENVPWCLGTPVAEVVDNKLVLIDGAHRIYHCKQRGIQDVVLAVIARPFDPPPSSVLSNWDSALPLPIHLSFEQRYNNFDYQRFRHIAKAWEHVTE